MDRLGFMTGSVVAVKSQSDAENGQVVVARIGEELTLKRYWRVDERQCRASSGELEPRAPADLD